MSETKGWTGGQRSVGDIAPALARYTDTVLFDEVWERPELSKRDRSLATVSALVALGATEQLTFHLAFARDHGYDALARRLAGWFEDARRRARAGRAAS